jgi:Family of unknown function (DUF6127)
MHNVIKIHLPMHGAYPKNREKYTMEFVMPEQNIQTLLERASEAGAQRALARLGLDDPSAAKDMTELRELLSAWRDAKRSARKAAIGWLVRMGLALLLIGLAVKLGLPGLVSQ